MTGLPVFGPRRWAGKVAAEALWLSAALLVLAVLGFLASALTEYQPYVHPEAHPDRLEEAKPLDAGWVWLMVVTSTALVASTGFPRLAGQSWRRARGGVAGAVLQGLAGPWIAGTTVFFHLRMAAAYRAYPDSAGCAHPNCWPEKAQAWSQSAAGLLTGLTLLVTAVLSRRLPWWARALAPVLVWVSTVLLQYGVLAPHLVPVFEGPPR